MGHFRGMENLRARHGRVLETGEKAILDTGVSEQKKTRIRGEIGLHQGTKYLPCCPVPMNLQSS